MMADAFTKRYKELMEQKGSDKLKTFQAENSGRNIRYVLWKQMGQPEIYVLWIEGMWNKFFKEAFGKEPEVVTPEIHIMFDNWLVEKCEIIQKEANLK